MFNLPTMKLVEVVLLLIRVVKKEDAENRCHVLIYINWMENRGGDE